MKTQAHQVEDRQRSRFEADLEASVGALFRRCPTLCGFTVQGSSELFVTEVSAYPCSPRVRRELCNEIVAALLPLIDECPAACELLPGRTFARVFH